MKSQRLVYPDILRILASFLVVLIHVTTVGISDYEIGSSTWCVSLVLNSVCHWAVPVFFMISGMFFLDPEREMPPQKLLKHILKIIICIAVWGFLYSLLDQYVYGHISAKSILIAVYGIITGNTGYHLWFLYTLLALYLATPTLRILTAHATKRQLEYALVVWFLLGICVSQVNELAECMLAVEEILPYESPAVAGFAGFYLLGYYLKKYTVPEKFIPALYILGLLCMIAMPIANLVLSEMMSMKKIPAITSQLGIASCIVAVSVFVLVSRLQTEKYSQKIKGSIQWLSDRTFGIYITHVFFVSLVFRVLKLELIAQCPPVTILGCSVGIFVISVVSSWLISKLSLIKRII